MAKNELGLNKYIAVICEGSAEQAIIDILLDNGLLIFDRSEIIDEKTIRCRSGNDFEKRYLGKSFESQISVIRILDSRNENFRISKAYRHKINVINVVTAPEIEILIIINEGEYDRYKKSHMKPSEYCNSVLKLKYDKSYEFVNKYFSDPEILIGAINEYSRVTNIEKGKHMLQDLLKK